MAQVLSPLFCWSGIPADIPDPYARMPWGQKVSPHHPGHLRPVIIKPVGRIFEISDLNPIRRKCGKCGRSLSPQKKQGSEEIPLIKNAENAENAENADTKTRKMRKMRLTGFNVTGFS